MEIVREQEVTSDQRKHINMTPQKFEELFGQHLGFQRVPGLTIHELQIYDSGYLAAFSAIYDILVTGE